MMAEKQKVGEGEEEYNTGKMFDDLLNSKAREEYKLNKLTAGCAEKNEASKKVLEKNGFKLEGKKEKHLFYNGSWMRQFDYGLVL